MRIRALISVKIGHAQDEMDGLDIGREEVDFLGRVELLDHHLLAAAP